MENKGEKLSDGKQKKQERQKKQQELRARREAAEAMKKKDRLADDEFAEAAKATSVHDYFDVDEEFDPKQEGLTQPDLSLVGPDVREQAEVMLERVARRAPNRSQARVADEFRTERQENVATEPMLIERAHSFVWTAGNARRDSNPIHLFQLERTALATSLNALLEDRRYLVIEDRLSTQTTPDDVSLAQLINTLSKMLGDYFEQVMIGGDEVAALGPSKEQLARLPANHSLVFWCSKDSVREIMLAVVFKENVEGHYAEIVTHFYVPPLNKHKNRLS